MEGLDDFPLLKTRTQGTAAHSCFAEFCRVIDMRSFIDKGSDDGPDQRPCVHAKIRATQTQFILYKM